MKNILVALDFEENSGLLIDHAVELAQKFGSKIWLIHTADNQYDFVGYEAAPRYVRDVLAEELRAEHRMLQTLVDDLEKKGIDADGLLVSGPTAKTILEEANQRKIDLIITGYHAHGVLHSALMGDVSAD